MSFINKVKNFFYEDVEDDEEYERNEIRKREEKERKRLEKLREKQRKNEEKERLELSRTEKIEELPKEDLSERELFKSEKTFNFPMNMGDDIFDDTIKMEPVEEIKQETKEYKTSTNIYASKPSKINERYENISKYQKEDPSEPKKFKPTPVVSPVYGILDKNYTVEEVVEKNLSKTKEYSMDKKIVDFDSVRNRAYKELDEEIEKTLTGTKDIFYNLDDTDDKTEEVVEEYSEPEDDSLENTTEVVITYDDEVEDETPVLEETKEEPVEEKNIDETEEDEDDFSMPDVEIPVVKKKRTRRSKVVDEDTDEKEDLFNLIDNMYKDDDEEEED